MCEWIHGVIKLLKATSGINGATHHRVVLQLVLSIEQKQIQKIFSEISRHENILRRIYFKNLGSDCSDSATSGNIGAIQHRPWS